MLVQRGMSLTFVIDLDIFSFNSLVETHFRLLARDRIEQAQTAQLSAQGSGKDLLKWLKKRWIPLLGGAEDDNDAAEFIKKFGGGM